MLGNLRLTSFDNGVVSVLRSSLPRLNRFKERQHSCIFMLYFFDVGISIAFTHDNYSFPLDAPQGFHGSPYHDRGLFSSIPEAPSRVSQLLDTPRLPTR